MFGKVFTIGKLAAIGLFLACQIPLRAAEPWWNSRWQFRRAISVEPKIELFEQFKINPRGRQAAQISTLTYGKSRPDGADLRIVGPDGKVRPLLILSIGPGDLVRVAFPISGQRQQRYFLYYGNPKARKENSTWRPQTGLLLETYKYAGGKIKTVEEIKSTFEKSRGKLIGRGFVPTVFIPGNIFGPQARTCNLYSGHFVCRQPGSYTFALSTSDASCLFIDDKLVLAWPGRHGWESRARHTAKVSLKQGLHELKLYHINLSGRGGAVVARAGPGKSRFQEIPAADFLPLAETKLGPLQDRRRKTLPDFTYAQKSFSLVGKRSIYHYQFRVLGEAKGKKISYVWDFGDGQQAKGREVEHLFLREDTFKVTLRMVAGGRGSANTAAIHIGPDRANWRAKPGRLKRYMPLLSTYDFSKAALRDTLTVMELYMIVDRADLAASSAQAAAVGGQLGKAKPKQVGRWARLLGRLLTEYQSGYEAAAEAYQAAIKNVPPSSSLRPQLVGRAVDVLVNNLGNDKLAERILTGKGPPASRPADEMPRPIIIAWGDLYRFRGNRELAEKFYRHAHEQSDMEPYHARSGGYAAAIEDYMRRKEYPAAARLIARWQREYPLQKLGGYSCYLLYRLYLARDRTRQAQLLAKIVNGIDPMGFYAQKMAPATR